jgi:hypothetical protein
MKDKPNLPISQAICNWQIAYRNVPHSYTGRPSAKLMIGRSLRTRLAILKQSFVNVCNQIRTNLVSPVNSFAPGI